MRENQERKSVAEAFAPRLPAVQRRRAPGRSNAVQARYAGVVPSAQESPLDWHQPWFGGRHAVQRKETSAQQVSRDGQRDPVREDRTAAEGALTVAKEDRGKPRDDQRIEDLIDGISDHLQILFDTLRDGVTAALRGLTEPAMENENKGVGARLAEVAASAAVAGVAGSVGSLVGDFVRGMVTGAQAGAISSCAKELTKNAVTIGSSSHADSREESPLSRFQDLQYAKIRLAHGAFVDAFHDVLVPRLRQFSEQRLLTVRTLVRETAAGGAYAAQKKSTQVEWVNFVARLHHGAEEDPESKSKSNVDPETVRDQGLVAITQKLFLPDRHGILEVGLEMTMDRTEDGLRVTEWVPKSLELRGVHPNAKAALRRMGTVRDVRVNKIVRVFTPQRLNPPLPEIAVLVTADGGIRGGGYAYNLPGISIEKAVEAAQDMSMGYLE